MNNQEPDILPEARLVGAKGLLSELEFKILADTIYIGRVSGNDVVLNDTSVSSQHAKITWENDNYIISDLESKNGISVNGKTVTKKVLRNSDKIKIGGTTFRFVYKPLVKESKGGDRGAEAGTNPVRIAIYAIGILIVLVILVRLLPTKTQQEMLPDSPLEVQVYMTLSQLKMKKPEGKISTTGNAEQDASNHYTKGIIYHDSGQFKKAIYEFNAAKEMMPAMEKYAKGIKTALEELNKEIDYHVRLGKVHSNHLRYLDAIKEWEYALFLIEDEQLPQYKKIQNDITIVRKRLEAYGKSY
ncbi:FHA domain-containing protein [candidate division CSSED10-310 bacterium]|uniref:FHA domain-containing protein n=1 Tax=candidate division CSSED10-310 bacterium TaxID=2855610 RepID=A0ABV6YWF0_UNCC1